MGIDARGKLKGPRNPAMDAVNQLRLRTKGFTASDARGALQGGALSGAGNLLRTIANEGGAAKPDVKELLMRRGSAAGSFLTAKADGAKGML